jgi:hypothetical protein
MNNLQLLIQRYQNVTLSMDQLAEVLHMAPKSVTDAAAAGRLPVATFKMGRKRLANIRDVAQYLDDKGTKND